MLAASINQKIEEYWKILDDATTVATILDPRNKITLFKLGEPTTKAINTLRDQLSLYLTQRPQLQTSLPKETSSSREYFRQLKRRRLGTTAETTQVPALSSPDFAEIERYLALPCDENVEALLWWRAHSAEFPILSLMARDYLAIQSTSVACEQAFSVAGNTITKTRNRLHSETARASLCTKSWIENSIGENVA